jgi:uncharacterized membrane protein YdjX (TVP38/TMEM64 family)
MTGDIEDLVHGAGIAGPIAFVAIYTLLTVALVPGTAPSVAAGALFGAIWGTVLTVIGATLGATAAYVLARRLGRAPVRARTGERFARLDAWVARRGFLAVLYVRLIPVFPFNAVNYAFGMTSVTPRAYIAATALGITPATIAFVAVGSSLHDPGSAGFAIALGVTAALTIAGAVVSRRSRLARPEAQPPGAWASTHSDG